MERLSKEPSGNLNRMFCLYQSALSGKYQVYLIWLIFSMKWLLSFTYQLHTKAKNTQIHKHNYTHTYLCLYTNIQRTLLKSN